MRPPFVSSLPPSYHTLLKPEIQARTGCKTEAELKYKLEVSIILTKIQECEDEKLAIRRRMLANLVEAKDFIASRARGPIPSFMEGVWTEDDIRVLRGEPKPKPQKPHWLERKHKNYDLLRKGGVVKLRRLKVNVRGRGE